MKRYSLTSQLLETPLEENRLSKGFLTKTSGLNDFVDQGQPKSGLTAADLKPVTKTIQKLHRNKRRYINTPNKIRIELIEAVHKHGEKIKFAAKRLGINYSSAKAICQVYKKEGRSDRILIKKRAPKQVSSEPAQEKLGFQATSEFKFQEKLIINEKNLLKTYENLTEDPFLSLEPYKAFSKEEKYSGSEKQSESIFKDVSSQGTLCQSLQEPKQGSYTINQTINQNNIFLTVQPNHFPQAEKLNIMAPNELIHANIQSNPAYFSLLNIQSQQEFISKMLNSSLNRQSVKSEFVNNHQGSLLMNLQKRFMQSYQNPLLQNLPPYSMSNFSLNPTLLPLNQFEINPTINLLSKNLDAQLSSLSALAPTLNGGMKNPVYNQGIYFSKS